MNNLFHADPCLDALISKEYQRQTMSLSLIASENYSDACVAQATASVLTNKYAEGYPSKRYYAGCQVIDQIEILAQQRCSELFGVDYVNVQPHSGSQANMAVYAACLKPGDTILGMSLADGGHLTHGHTVNFSGIFYNSVSYGLDPSTERIDYEQIERLADKHKPTLIIAGASAYSRLIDFERFAAIARKNNALLLADIAHIAGLIAARLHPSPVGHADIITTTTHKTLRGPRGGLIMARKELGPALNRAIMPGTQGGPCMNIIAAKAYCFYRALQPDFVVYQQQVIINAQAMAALFLSYGYQIVSGGTDNHLFVIDVRSINITGLEAQNILESVGITSSRSCIPNDPQKPWITSGLRLGTPAITTRGFKEQDSEYLAELIHRALTDRSSHHIVRAEINTLCQKFLMEM